MTDSKERTGKINRRTKETDIDLDLLLDGNGRAMIETGVGFMDHMLTLLTVHSFFDLTINARGDVQVDDHHTVEDLGICLGMALKKAVGEMAGITRYGHSYVPMDETLVRVCVDFSNRPYLHYNAVLPDQKVGSFDTSLAKEFLRALVLHGGLTLHVDLLHGENTHHIIEAVFKALGKALSAAVTIDSRVTGQLSSKGTL
ncbi:MAG: imidazoleglycerol-phosphate dehydratase HisB [Desulfobulbaceae bacterium]|nr:imidazoleglycerol-phosphate dehydratase HisB [Desulfobulbaceae bacterium]